ncbi:response regulator receiver protein [Halorubrum persicum]|uniref:Response regulator receiver protein n=1 Tax=Halorubrum persicum TaxID=1383844 RepID=A0A2G1WJB9_9EURY|nr:response regulator receiver protein [Halorubrum persicum]
MIPVELPASEVVICETNKTRADLYGLWLDDYDPRRALTTAQFAEAFDAGVAVVVLDGAFGDGEAEAVLDTVRSGASHCRVLGIRERSNTGPAPAYDRNIERPVFETELAECVETLFHRANYHLLLDQYYRTTVLVSAYEWQGSSDGRDNERYERLRDRAARLEGYLNGLRPRMSDEDVRAVADGITVTGVDDTDDGPSIESKYRPDECARCGRDWTGGADGEAPTVKLAAYVWRCDDCGHVDMRADPNHRHVTSFRR